ncbi:hypothetical protein N7462_005343 [Penicillium macrosclerotiorum]|uniref:uncharacterized protein n=1 Tax=Penicillium macrosclerotiorum TaxID=303699 RepID=UPI0025468CDA|nr:uncharacterized protein N7462_005343 [Penicillium macrosclerotiorum]KAJ5682178.1 hypothetical protein N7462_005343 [Penicillium macrosclerotiorum]
MIGQPRVFKDGLTITRATPEDVKAIKTMVDAAYAKYIDRIGKPPAPMTEDYQEVIQSREVFVLREKIKTVGSIVLMYDADSSSAKIDNLVVDPMSQGRGYARVLMEYAEEIANSENLSALTLYTNVKMYENLEIYRRMGFEEIGRREEDGYDRIYFRKNLSKYAGEIKLH